MTLSCGELPENSIIVYQVTDGPFPSWPQVVNDTTTFKLILNSLRDASADDFSINLQATEYPSLTTMTRMIFVNLYDNTPPYFEATLSDIELHPGESILYKLPNVVDDNDDDPEKLRVQSVRIVQELQGLSFTFY